VPTVTPVVPSSPTTKRKREEDEEEDKEAERLWQETRARHRVPEMEKELEDLVEARWKEGEMSKFSHLQLLGPVQFIYRLWSNPNFEICQLDLRQWKERES